MTPPLADYLRERRAEVDAALARVLAARPASVVLRRVDPADPALEARGFVMRQLARHYRLVDQFALSERVDQLYRRVD